MKKLFVLAAANFVGPLLQFVASPLVSRIYAPPAFGSYALTYSASIFLSMILAGFVYQGLIVEEEEIVISSLYYESLAITVVAAIGVFIVVALLSNRLPPELNPFKTVTLALLIGLGQIQTFLFANKDKTQALSRLLIIKAVVLIVLQLVLGRSQPTVGALLSAAILSEVAFFAFGLVEARSYLPKPIPLKTLLLFSGVKRHLNYPKKFLPAQLISFAINLMPLAAMSLLGASQIAGFFAFSLRLTQAPGSALVNAIRASYWRSFRSVRISVLTMKIVKYGHLILIIASFAIYLLPKHVSALAFGSNWSGVTEVLAVVGLWVGGSVITQFPAEITKHSNQQGLIFWVELGGAVVKGAGAAIFVGGLDLKTSLIIFCLLGYFFNLVASGVYLTVYKNRELRCAA